MSESFPVSFEVRPHGVAVAHQPLDRVGDLELPPEGGFDLLDRLEHVGIEEVDAHQRQVGDELLRFFHEADDLPVTQLHHAELPGVFYTGQQDLAVGRTGPELVDDRGHSIPQEIVAQNHDEGVALQESLRHHYGVGQPAGTVLLDVGRPDAEPCTVANRLADLLPRLPHDDSDVGHPRRGQLLKAVKKDGFVGDGEELLGAREGDRPEPRPLSSA